MAVNKCVVAVLLGVASQMALADWQQHNRAVSITSGLMKQDYHEKDKQGLTDNGILNTEKSNIHEIAFNGRWQQAKQGVWVQGRASSVTGATKYDGYLQNGSQLTPYETVTDNRIYEVSTNIGYAIPVGEKLAIIPNISGHHEHWDRELVQYNERFSTQSAMAGAVIQYQVSPKIGVEVSADVGKNVNSELKVVKHNFEQDLAKQNIWQVGAKASYQLTEKLAVIGEVNHRQKMYGESTVENGLQYPSGESKQTSGLVGVRVSY